MVCFIGPNPYQQVLLYVVWLILNSQLCTADILDKNQWGNVMSQTLLFYMLPL